MQHSPKHRSLVGVFASEADVQRIVARFPGLHEDDGVFWLEPSEVPELTEIEHNGWVFPLARASFSTYQCDGVIDVIWNEVHLYAETPPTPGDYATVSMSVNGYTFDAASGVEHVHARERLFAEAQAYFGERGDVVGREALGSQDGEYVTVAATDGNGPGHLAFLLDPAAVHLREQAASFEEFLRRYPEDIA